MIIKYLFYYFISLPKISTAHRLLHFMTLRVTSGKIRYDHISHNQKVK